MIDIRNLTKFYGKGNQAVRALNEVTLQIEEGMFGLLGPNGAGKTTLMRILAGIVQPSRGQVVINGLDLSQEKDKQRLKAQLGYLPQELGLYPDLSAREFIDYMAILKGMHTDSERRKRIREVLELAGLQENADRKIKGFSGGMKRRVGIAQAIVNDPRILIVDEPTAGLDPEERIRFRNLLVKMAADRVILLSTHIVEDIGLTSQKMAVLSHGDIQFVGSPSELIRKAEGHVWELTTTSTEKPDGGLTIVSMLHQSDGIRYRLVGEHQPADGSAKAVKPGLEDGYIRLMHQ
ncbi:MAG: ABC transporter ATP-binding protein [Chloroflexi bacterium]|nr:ABC transporter ATP-binding protein [Chloroflexota bacterium]